MSRRSARFLRVNERSAGYQRERGRLDGLIEGDLTDASLKFQSMRAIERIGRDARDTSLGLANDDCLIDHSGLALDGAGPTAEPSSQVRNLAADESPVPAMCLIQYATCAEVSRALKLFENPELICNAVIRLC
jgi:hypothetical protein